MSYILLNGAFREDSEGEIHQGGGNPPCQEPQDKADSQNTGIIRSAEETLRHQEVSSPLENHLRAQVRELQQEETLDLLEEDHENGQNRRVEE